MRSYYAFEFIDGFFQYTGFDSKPEGLSEYLRDWYPMGYVEAELVVLPRKGRRNNPVTHSQLRQQKPGVFYLAVVERDVFHQMCETVEADWKARKARLREQCAAVNRRSRAARLEDLPVALKRRIRVGEKGCWLWVARKRRMRRWPLEKVPVKPNDYGKITFEGRKWAAHRLVYSLLVGEIPEGAVLLHSCDTPACVHPDHLTPGPDEDNLYDMIAKGRAAWQQRSG